MNRIYPFPETKLASGRRATSRLVNSLTVAVSLSLVGCSSVKLVSLNDVPNVPVSRPTVVYVADFDLAPGSIQSETPAASLPLHSYLEQRKAQSLVVTMNTSIVDDLINKGVTAERLPSGTPLPKHGWLVRGVFQRIDEGDRLKRAVIGFGSGQTDLAVTTSTDELSAGTAPAPLYTAQTNATSNKMPGAAVTLNPYVAAAKFVLAGRDLDRSTQATAQKIADLVVARVTGMPQNAQQ